MTDKIQGKYIDHYGIDSLPHLKEAVAAGADVFLTLNESLIKDRPLLEKKFKIRILTPAEAIEEI